MPKVFVSNVGGYVGQSIARAFLAAEHEVVGTVKKGMAPEGVSDTFPASKRKVVEAAMLDCDVIVWTLDTEMKETKSAVRCLQRKSFATEKILIIVSTALVWGKTAADTLLSEASYRSRRPPDALLQVKSLESQALSIRKNNLRVVVIGSGLMYGRGEDSLHHLFRYAWMESEGAELPVLFGHQVAEETEEDASTAAVADGDEEQEGKEAPQTKMLNGNNVVPLIHVDDLGSCVAAVAASPPEDLDYIVAVDEGTFTIRDITSSIAGALNSGAIRDLTEEETAEYLLANSDDATAFEKLSHNLKFKTEDAYIHSLSFDWVSKEGIVASIDTVVEQFKVARNLTPLKVVMIGPPSLPKQMFASRIAKKYYLPLLSVKDLVNEVLAQSSGTEDAPNTLKAELEAVGDARPGSDLLGKLFKAKMETGDCQKKGFVLADAPLRAEEAIAIFGLGEEGGEGVDEALKPSAVVLIEGEDDFLTGQVMALSEEDNAMLDGIQARYEGELSAYREANKDEAEATTATFFENECAMEIQLFSVGDGNDENEMMESMSTFVEGPGKPYNYHPTPAERAAAEADRKAAEEQEAKQKEAEEEAQRAEEERQAKEHEEENARRTAEAKEQERLLLEARSKPLRGYLMDNVVPLLTQGLVETCKVAPPDPIDYLAEFLFRNAPAEETEVKDEDE